MKKDYLIVANIENIEASEFLVLLVYENGHQVDKIVKKCTDKKEVLDTLFDLSITHGTEVFDLWTSTPKIYEQTIRQPGFNVSIKHPSDTTVTNAVIRTDREVLRELYEIEPLEEPEEKPELPKWRAKLINWLMRLINIIRGNYDYEIR